MGLGCRMHPLILFEPAATHYSLTEVPPYGGIDLNASVINAHPFQLAGCLFLGGALLDIEDQPVRVANIAARHRQILFIDSATGSE
jgi:hypothetical protein